MKKLLPLIPFLFAVSCQPKAEETTTEETPAPITKAPVAAIDVSKPESLIGQPLEKIQEACDAAKVRHRVIEIDGEAQITTRDYLPERLNFAVKKGVITKVTKG